MAPDTLVSFHIGTGQKKAGFGKIIGEYADPDTKSQKTTMGLIHYSKKGTHIIPSHPKK